MRSLLAMLCAAVVSLSAPCARAATATGPATAAESPEKLYEDGRKDYRLGRFQDAIDKWERAYSQSELPLLLYNIALAYRQLYDVSADLEDLRKGKVVLKNFLVVAERDPDVDPADANLLMQEIDDLVAAHEKRLENDTPAPVPEAGPPRDRPMPVPPSGEDPGRKLRIAGAATMGVGGVFVVAGVVLGVVFALKGREFRDDLANARTSDANGDPCSSDPLVTCDAVIETARDNGRAANLYSGVGFGLGAGLGVAAIVAGAVVFVQGNKRSAAWSSGRAARLRIAPSGLGLSVHGRF